MIASLNWLKEFIDISLTPLELSEKLTALGLECTIETEKHPFTDVVIGEVEDRVDHPNADNLSLCQVNIGNGESKQIVCGAPNVKAGIKVPVIKVGGTLEHGKFKIKKTKLRGEVSNGMICSEKELGLGENHEGILVLDTELEIGTPFEQSLFTKKDTIIDFDLTPNRGDCFSHLGIAREIALIENSKVSERKVDIKESAEKTSDFINIKINNEAACPKYSGRIIKNVKIGESPDWVKNRLESVGLNSVNNIVDAANYVMLDCGHPLHTFDLNKISNNEIIVRFPQNNEKLTMLDESELELNEKHLLICDNEKPLALAGVMGGFDSGINENTTDILIESAYFNAEVIRRSAKSLDISTDSSRRFERGADINNVDKAINQCAQLIQQTAGGDITQGIVNSGKSIYESNKVSFRWEYCNQILGIHYSKDDYSNYFRLLNFDVEEFQDKLVCNIPSYRNDLSREIDLCEEAARVIGYDKIPPSALSSTSFSSFMNDENSIMEILRNAAEYSGFNEHYSNSLYPQNLCEQFSNNPAVPISNPLSRDMAFLRNSLIPGLMKSVSINSRNNNQNYKLFEIGQIHKYIEKIKTKSVENPSLGLVWAEHDNQHWRSMQNADLFTAKGELEQILRKITPNIVEYKINESPGFEYSLDVIINKSKIGVIGKILPQLLEQLDIKNSVVVFEGNIDKLKKIQNSSNLVYDSPSQFPSVYRDIAILIDKNINSNEVERLIKQNGSNFLKEIKLFDLYENEELGLNKKSMAYSLQFQSNEKTLNDKSVDKIIHKIFESLTNKFGVKQR